MTEEIFYNTIKQKTNWDVNNLPENKSFGFIIGVCHPFVSIGAVSSSYIPNFVVWKKEDNNRAEETIDCSSPDIMLEKIIEFLNKPF